MTCLFSAGAAAADMSTERRHDRGQRLANITFREFLVKMVDKYGDAALAGMENFSKDSDRRAVSALEVCQNAFCVPCMEVLLVF